MRSFNANFITEKNRRSDGPTPINLLKFNFSTPVYLSDRDITPSGGSAHSGLVKSWGFIDSSVSQTPGKGVLGVIETSDLALTIINSESPRFSDNFTDDDPPENVTVELYQWFDGLLDSEKEIIFKGVIQGKIEYDLYECKITVKGIWEKYNKKIGEDLIISADDFADADPDDIGKMQSIGYGSLTKIPCRAIESGAVDNLESDISASQTSIEMSDASEFASSGTIGVDDEEITYTGKTGDTLTGCTRGANGTDAVTHAEGSAVWQIKTRFVYQVCGHPVKSIGDVYCDGTRITSIVTKYTGQSGDELSGYEGMAVFTVPYRLTRQQAIDLLVDDGMTINDAIAVVDTIDVDDGISVSDTIGVTTGSHSHAISESVVTWNFETTTVITATVDYGYAMVDSDLDTSCRFSNSGAEIAASKVYYESQGGTPAYVRVCMYLPDYFGTGTVRARLYNSGSVYLSGTDVTGNAYGTYKGSWVAVNSYFNTWAKMNEARVRIYCTAYTSDVRVAECWLEIKTAEDTEDSAATGVSKTGSASKSGAATKSGSATKGGTVTREGAITLTGNSVADVRIGSTVTATLEGYQDDASGTYTGTPNALIHRCDHIFKHIWCALLGAPAGDIDTITFDDAGVFYQTNSYTFSLLINSPVQAETLFMRLALQCRSRFFVTPAGAAKLIVRETTRYSSRGITQNEIRQNSVSVQRRPFDELINYFNIYYNRDHSTDSDQSDSYKAVKPFSDSTSISRYGQQEWTGDESLFLFDAVTDESMVSHVGAYLLEYHSQARRIPSFSVFLDNCEIEPGDILTLTHDLDNMESFGLDVQKIVHTPGSGNRSLIDFLKITGVEVTVVPLTKTLEGVYDIYAQKSIEAPYDIYAQKSIEAPYDIYAQKSIEGVYGILVRKSIEGDYDILIQKSIEAVYDILSVDLWGDSDTWGDSDAWGVD